jgi:aminoglycoside 6-adenylyltransferase
VKPSSQKLLLDRILQWAQTEESIRAIILQGSHAAGLADSYSDYDLAIFCLTYAPYTKDEKWLSNIGQVWICVHEKIEQGHAIFPTRLVIFEDGIKVDFIFYTIDLLHHLAHTKLLPAEYDRGFSVLLDKESHTTLMPKASHKEKPSEKPSKQEFNEIVKEFWFEVYHVAIYLKRDDLWSVKFRSRSICDHFLLKMIEWNEEAKCGWESTAPPLGKRIRSWVSEDTWNALHHVFAHFDSADSWLGLKATIELFRRLAIDTSSRLGYSYPDEIDKNISNFIESSVIE